MNDVDADCPVIANLILLLRSENAALRSLNAELREVIAERTEERDEMRDWWMRAEAEAAARRAR